MRLAVKNWAKFQHYKDRSPPWVKLHRALLDDYDFQRLPIASKALAPMVWLLAAETADGSIEGDPQRLAFRLRWTTSDIEVGLSALIENGFLTDASDALADCLQDAPPENREQRKRVDKPSGLSPPHTPHAPPDGLDADAWQRWASYRAEVRKPIKPASLLAAQRKLAGFGADQAAVVEQSIANGWQGLFPLNDDQRQQPQQTQRRSIHDDRAATIAALTGRDRTPADGQIIDITPTDADIVG